MASAGAIGDDLVVVGILSKRRVIGPQEMDAFLEENHELAAEVTTEPVEEGEDVADHVIQMPDRLRIIAQVSNHPLEVDENNPEPLRAESAWSKLVEMKREGQPITVLTSLGALTDYVINALNVTRTAKLANVIRVTIGLVHVSIVRSGQIDLPETTMANERAKPTVDKGAQPTQDASAQQGQTFGAKVVDNFDKVKGLIF